MKNAIKVLCFVLAVILICSGAFYFAFIWQKGEFEIEDGVNSGTAVITAYIGDSANVKIPNRIRGKKIVAINKNAFKETDVVSVELNEYITSIGKDAFYECEKLESVTLKNVKSIGETSFGGCTSLKKIVLPATLEKIDPLPFVYDTALTDVTFEENSNFVIDNGVIYNADKTELVTVLPSSGITEYTCPETLTVIDEYAFANQTQLTSFKYNSKISVIKLGTFTNCTALKELDIPANITEIAAASLSQTGITTLTIPATVTRIDSTAFLGNDDNFTIKTTSGSYAETFANENEIKLEII